MRYQELTIRLCEYIPETLAPGILYVSERFETAIHLCVCGCGTKVVTHWDEGGWTLTLNADKTVATLSPSILHRPCGSHYFLRENRVVPC